MASRRKAAGTATDPNRRETRSHGETPVQNPDSRGRPPLKMIPDDSQISDLFFNHQHPKWEQYKSERAEEDLQFDAKQMSPEDIREGILPDARDFEKTYPEFGHDGEWYADDFVRRYVASSRRT